MAARDIFEEARDASWELHRHDMRYNAMEARALSLGGQAEAHVSSGGIADRMRSVDALVDYEAMMGRYEREWCAKVDRAVALLYGWDWQGGIARSLGMAYAEVLECIYIKRMTMRETAAYVHWSPRKCCDMRREAFAHIDAAGEDAAAAGE